MRGGAGRRGRGGGELDPYRGANWYCNSSATCERFPNKVERKEKKPIQNGGRRSIGVNPSAYCGQISGEPKPAKTSNPIRPLCHPRATLLGLSRRLPKCRRAPFVVVIRSSSDFVEYERRFCILAEAGGRESDAEGGTR